MEEEEEGIAEGRRRMLREGKGGQVKREQRREVLAVHKPVFRAAEYLMSDGTLVPSIYTLGHNNI